MSTDILTIIVSHNFTYEVYFMKIKNVRSKNNLFKNEMKAENTTILKMKLQILSSS